MTVKFKSIYLEITDICGLECPFCPSKNLLKKGSLSLDVIYERLKKIKGYSSQVYLHILGDPLMHPGLKEILNFSKEEGLKIALTTNALNIDKLKDYPSSLIKINISLQSLITSNDLKGRLEKIISFLKNKPDALAVVLRLWNNKEDTQVQTLNSETKSILDDFLKNNQIKNVSYSYDDEFTWPSLNFDKNLLDAPCLGGKMQLGVLLNGDVVLCCLDWEGHTKIGNLNQESFEDILKSQDYLSAIKGWNDRKPYFELCQKCTYRNRFKK